MGLIPIGPWRSNSCWFKRNGYALTCHGRRFTEDLIRCHRLYESYLHGLGYPSDHMHAPADRVEHHLSKETVQALVEATSDLALDPQGKPIPRVHD